MGGITYFPAYFSYLETLEDLNDEQVGRVFRAALKYASTGETSELESAEKVAFKFIKREIDESQGKYEKMRSANAQNGSKGGRPAKAAYAEEKPPVSEKSEKSDRFSEKPKETDRFSEKPKKAIENEKEKEKENNTVSNDTVYAPDGATSIRKPRNMIPPDPDAVRSFIAEHGLNVDADAFIDYYAAQGWKLSNGIPMKDWQAAVRKWSRNEASPRAAPAGTEDRDPMLAYLDSIINGEEDNGHDKGGDGGNHQGPEDGLSGFLFPLQGG